MFDASTVVNPVMQSSILDKQPLPMPSSQDMLRFENILRPSITDSLDANNINASVLDRPILQVKEPLTSDSFDFKSRVISKVAEMDQSYHQMMSRLSSMPKFSEYLAEKQVDNEHEKVRSYPNTPDSNNVIKQIETVSKSTADNVLASADYSHMLTHWGMNSQMWMGKMNIVVATVGQISQSFKTLFQAG